MICSVCQLELGIERRPTKSSSRTGSKIGGSVAAVVPEAIRCGVAICCRSF